MRTLSLSQTTRSKLAKPLNEFKSRTKPIDRQDPIWEPHKGKPQEAAYNSPASIIGFGGAAGGGKTDLLLGFGMTKHLSGVIYRLHFKDLQDMIDRGEEILDGKAEFHYGRRRWHLPGGRILRMEAVEKIKDLRKYRGRARDFIGIDEAAEMPEQIVRMLDGWRRTTVEGQETRLVMGFNPPMDESGEWIVSFFAPWLDQDHPDPAEPGELRWFIRDGEEDADIEVPGPGYYEKRGDGEYEPVDYETIMAAESRTFFPANVDDNPAFADGEYKRRLANLPEPARSQLLFGDFHIGARDDEWQWIPTEWIDLAMKWWREQEPPDLLMRALGIDVARGGKDNTVLVPLFGNWFGEPIVKPGSKTRSGEAILDLVIQLFMGMDEYLEHPPKIGVDVTGVGSSPYDFLRKEYGRNVFAFNAGARTKARDDTRKFGFANLRAYSTYLFRAALDPESGENIALPNSRTLRADLRSLRYRVRDGKYKVEDKEEIRKRLGRSPDEGDAIIIAWYYAVKSVRPIA